MMETGAKNDLQHLIYLSVAIWLGYLVTLAGIDQLFYPRPLFRLFFYVINGMDALLVLALAITPRTRARLGRFFLPLVIVLLSVVPNVIGNLALRGLPRSPASSPEGIMLRLMPMMFMALVLTAWQYRWRHVVFFTIAMAGVNLLLHGVFFHPPSAPYLPPLTVLVIQTVSFLLVGYFISTLVSRLRAQHASLEQANQKLVHYAGALEHLTITRERNRLARELHDTLAHALSALSVQLETVKAYFDVDYDTARRLLDNSVQTTRSGLLETRRAMKALRASPLDDLGLLLALREMAEEASSRAGMQLHLSLPGEMAPLSHDVEQVVYRVAQEAVANVAHHANAQNLTLQLMVNEGCVLLLVRDDGLGFNAEENPAVNHYGLAGMRERAHLVGGKLTVDSRPGEGTTISLKI